MFYLFESDMFDGHFIRGKQFLLFIYFYRYWVLSHLLSNLVQCLGLISEYIGPVPLPTPSLWGSHVPHVTAHVALASPEAATPAYILALQRYIFLLYLKRWNITKDPAQTFSPNC